MIKLNIGCGNDILEGYINHDITKHRDDIDVAFDLEDKHWNYDEKENVRFVYKFDEIRAFDVLEHLNDPINFMDNCWSLLKEDGILHVKVCGWQNPNFHVDPTHKHAYDIKSFDYFDPSTQIGTEYGFYTKKRWKILDKKYDKHKNPVVKLTPIK